MSPVVRPFLDRAPKLASGVYLTETAVVVGDVELGEDVSVWYGAVLRGDVGHIRIGARTNVQDLVCIHMSLDKSNAEIGSEVTIGHSAVIHGARIGDGALIGIGSILLDNANIGAEAMIGAGTLVPLGMVVPARTLVLGRPGRVIRDLTEEEWMLGRKLAERYVGVARDHQRSLGPANGQVGR
jgi:gamma-carbonic anhydrase